MAMNGTWFGGVFNSLALLIKKGNYAWIVQGLSCLLLGKKCRGGQLLFLCFLGNCLHGHKEWRIFRVFENWRDEEGWLTVLELFWELWTRRICVNHMNTK